MFQYLCDSSLLPASRQAMPPENSDFATSSILVGAASTSLICRPTGKRKANSSYSTLSSSVSATKYQISLSANSFLIETLASYPATCPAAAMSISTAGCLLLAIPTNDAVSPSSLLFSPSLVISVSRCACFDPMASRVWLLVCPALGVGSPSTHVRRCRSVLRN